MGLGYDKMHSKMALQKGICVLTWKLCSDYYKTLVNTLSSDLFLACSFTNNYYTNFHILEPCGVVNPEKYILVDH